MIHSLTHERSERKKNSLIEQEIKRLQHTADNWLINANHEHDHKQFG